MSAEDALRALCAAWERRDVHRRRAVAATDVRVPLTGVVAEGELVLA